MKVRVRVHDASLDTLPRVGDVAGGPSVDDAPPGQVRLRGLAPDLAAALPRPPPPPRPPSQAIASLQAAAGRLAQGSFDPRVATMLRRAQELLGLLDEVERRRRGGPA